MNTKELTLSSIFTVLIVISSYIAIPVLPSVPITMQTLMVTLTGLLLGIKLASFSVLIYVILLIIGVPVSSGGGGVGILVGPTGGFIIGFFLVAIVAGANKRFVTDCVLVKEKLIVVILATASAVVVYFLGVPWYMIVTKSTLTSTLATFGIFYIFDILKAVIASFVYFVVLTRIDIDEYLI